MIRAFRASEQDRPQPEQRAKTDGSVSTQLHLIAHRLERLVPDTWNPETYFEKSELVRQLRQLGHRVRDARA